MRRLSINEYVINITLLAADSQKERQDILKNLNSQLSNAVSKEDYESAKILKGKIDFLQKSIS